jgi:hypothetical protein
MGNVVKIDVSTYNDMFNAMGISTTRFSELSSNMNQVFTPIIEACNRLDISVFNRMEEIVRPITDLYSNYNYMNSIAESGKMLTETMRAMVEVQEFMPDFSAISGAIQRITPDIANYENIAANLQAALSTWKYIGDEVHEKEYCEKDESNCQTQIAENTRFQIWTDDLNQDYLEISYELNGEIIDGYIRREDLENNTRKISDGI